MDLRQALASYGIKMPEPEPQVDPRDIERERERRETAEREAFFRDNLAKTMRGE